MRMGVAERPGLVGAARRVRENQSTQLDAHINENRAADGYITEFLEVEWHIDERRANDGPQCKLKGSHGIVVYGDLLAALREHVAEMETGLENIGNHIVQNGMAQTRLSELIGMLGCCRAPRARPIGADVIGEGRRAHTHERARGHLVCSRVSKVGAVKAERPSQRVRPARGACARGYRRRVRRPSTRGRSHQFERPSCS